MMRWTLTHIERLGGKASLLPNPNSTAARALPPILLGDFVVDPKMKTVCVYGHLDVQPAKKEDGWDSDPFILTERDGKLFGRGTTDDKGPALSWLWVIEAYQALNVPLPVNVKLLFEGMEESGSEGMFETIADLAKPGKFLNDVDFFCISDNYWLGKTKPCITYGLRGIAYFEVSVRCAEQDLHSGVIGGTIHEGMTDLVKLMASLVDSATGEILVNDIMRDVDEVTDDEEKIYESIDFDIDAYRDEIKVCSSGKKLLLETSLRIQEPVYRTMLAIQQMFHQMSLTMAGLKMLLSIIMSDAWDSHLHHTTQLTLSLPWQQEEILITRGLEKELLCFIQ